MAKTCVLRSAGTNCEEESAHAFGLAGALVETLHVGAFIRGERRLEEFDILVFPGGFSYGDDLGAGTVLANQLRARLEEDLRAFVDSGKLLLGICNGFQVLVRLGFLPGWEGEKSAALIENVSGRFEDRWVDLRVDGKSPFLDGARPEDTAGGREDGSPRVVRFPVAHREGRFVLRNPGLLERLIERRQIAFTYCRPGTAESASGAYPANPNGSLADIAGITNERGNVLGLMPHPERAVHRLHDPLWTRRPFTADESPGELARAGDGYFLFASAVDHVARSSSGSRRS